MKRSLLLLPIFSLCGATAVAATLMAPAVCAAYDDATKGVSPPPRYQQEGRPADAVPAGPDSVPLAPPPAGAATGMQVGSPTSGDPKFGGVLYEKQRIKRTVPLDPTPGLEGRWDVLYSYVDTLGGADTPGGSGVRTVYCDWDDNYLYFAVETPKPTDVRFEIDAQNDGWLHGADNLSIQVSPPAEGSKDPIVTAQRLDNTQNKDRPVYAQSPIPATSMKAMAGTTARNTYGVTLAVPRTEVVGLKRQPGSTFGFRVESGLLPAQVGEADTITIRPMLRLTLADSVAAVSDTGLSLRVLLPSGHNNVSGEQVRATLEAKNNGKTPLHVARLFLRGSLETLNSVDSATFNGIILNPGQTIRRELHSSVAATADPGTYVIAGGAEWEDGTAVAALASFDRLEPYSLDFKMDERPVRPEDAAPAKQKRGAAPVNGAVRTAVVAATSRAHDRSSATVHLTLPDGWALQSGDLNRSFDLKFAGDTRPQYFQIVVPKGAPPGKYPITATLEAAGRTYTASRQIVVEPDGKATAQS